MAFYGELVYYKSMTLDSTAPRGPYLIIVRGVPGGGKTYLTTELAKALGEDRVVVLDPDAIDKSSSEYQVLSRTLAAEGVDEKFHLYRFSRAKAFDGIASGKIIIWNQPFIDLNGFRITIDRLQAYAAEHATQLPLLVVEVELGEAMARQRVADRKEQGGHGPDADVFDKFMRDYRSFASEGYATVTVHGDVPVSDSVATVLSALGHGAKS